MHYIAAKVGGAMLIAIYLAAVAFMLWSGFAFIESYSK